MTKLHETREFMDNMHRALNVERAERSVRPVLIKNEIDGPTRTIFETTQLDHNPTPDDEPHCQRLILECGHWCYWTYGSKPDDQPKLAGNEVRCFKCAQIERLDDSRAFRRDPQGV